MPVAHKQPVPSHKGVTSTVRVTGSDTGEGAWATAVGTAPQDEWGSGRISTGLHKKRK